MSEQVTPTSEKPSSLSESDERGLEPAILLIGAGSELEEALSIALSRHGLFVESTTQAEAVSLTIAAAPDLILLAGEAARDGGVEVLQRLAESPLTSVVPVALLHQQASIDDRLQAFRHGAVAVIPRSASIDTIADEVARLALEIPERAGASLGQLGESTLRDFVDALSRELRNGVLSVKGKDSAEEVRLVLGEGRPLAELVNDFVSRVQQHVVSAEPLKYEFDERAAGTVAWLGSSTTTAVQPPEDLAGLPVALADPDAARADLLAQALRERGATVMVTDLKPQAARYARLRQMDPSVILMGADDVQGLGYELVRRMKRDQRLRWTSLLVVSWNEIIPEEGLPSLERLIPRMMQLTAPERSLQSRIASTAKAVGVRLESIGPSHLLRLLVKLPHATRVEVQHRRLKVTIDVAEHVIAGATATVPEAPDRRFEGPLALAALLQLSSGRTRVDRVTQPAATNLMATLESALDLADREEPPIPASIPSPIWSHPPRAGTGGPLIPSAPKAPSIGEISGAPPLQVKKKQGAPPRSALAPVQGSTPSAKPKRTEADATGLDAGWSSPAAERASNIESPHLPHRPMAQTVLGLAPAQNTARGQSPPGAAAKELDENSIGKRALGIDFAAELDSLLDADVPRALFPERQQTATERASAADTVLASHATEAQSSMPAVPQAAPDTLTADTIVDAIPLDPVAENSQHAGGSSLPAADTFVDGDIPEALRKALSEATAETVKRGHLAEAPPRSSPKVSTEPATEPDIPEAVRAQGAPNDRASPPADTGHLLRDMPSPGRDFDTLVEGAIEALDAHLGALNVNGKSAADAESAAIRAQQGALVAGAESADVHSPQINQVPSGASSPNKASPLRSTADTTPDPSMGSKWGLVGALQRAVLKLRPELGKERARSLSLIGLVAVGSLVAAFVIVLAIGVLISDRGDTKDTGTTQSPSVAHREAAASTVREAASSGNDRKPQAARPVDSASENTAPTCDFLERTSKTALQRFPGASFYQVKLGRKALVRGDIDAAQLAYCRAVILDAGSATAQSELARLYILRRDGKGAAKQAKIAMALEPKSRVLRGVFGDALARLGRFAEARDAWIYEAQVDANNHQSMQALYDRMLKAAEREEQKGSWVEAERFYRRTAILKPDDGRGPVGLALALARLGEHERAAKWARYAQTLGGHGERARSTLMRVLADAERH